jgi:hypothetical protein
MAKFLNERADHDEEGSWGRNSDGWPGIGGDQAYDMWVFANCVQTAAPYGGYVLISERGKYGATESYLRVHADFLDALQADFKAAGEPTAEQSVQRREQFGKLRKDGLREAAPKWWDDAPVPPATPPAHDIIQDVMAEVARATVKFPTWPTDALHAFAVVGEEFGELQKEVLQLTYEPHKSSTADVRKEAIQMTAMAIRFLMSLDTYRYLPGPQHAQPPLPQAERATL